jgi:hypothetical protein
MGRTSATHRPGPGHSAPCAAHSIALTHCPALRPSWYLVCEEWLRGRLVARTPQAHRTCGALIGRVAQSRAALDLRGRGRRSAAARTRAKRARPEGPVLARTRRRSRSSRRTSEGSSTNSHPTPGDAPRWSPSRQPTRLLAGPLAALSPGYAHRARALVLNYFSSPSTCL